MRKFLKDNDKNLLRKLHRKTKSKRLADRIKCILALDSGFTYKEIKRVLLLDEASVNNYKKYTKKAG